MPSTWRLVLVACVFMSVPSLAWACLWDYDTLLAERSRFPTTLELITGKFLRHSPEFYEWRVKDRTRKLETDPENLELLDDLAVAYDKLGMQERAIELMERKERIKPGLYETAANHGTFLAHAGKLEESLPFLKRAIEINPAAHFGREKYQIYLIEFALEKPVDQSFWQFLGTRNEADTDEQRQAAIKGVLGIIRFGNHDNPRVLEALASLLTSYEPESRSPDAKALAARAYLKASYLTKDDTKMSSKLRDLATRTLDLQATTTFTKLEAEFQSELAEADAWYRDLQQRELTWIAAGTDVDAEFARLYQQEPRSLAKELEPHAAHATAQRDPFARILVILSIVLFFGFVAFVATIYAASRWLSGKRILG
ncbi:tetratricopeptide repeat protein [Anatilimnocola sp. NA78]|uniref:tetratricopeptide repeat protein n=1 Tax=Anatilimnocola sp. NA78 TaxID=3415683 RepID=UPI003CE48DDC